MEYYDDIKNVKNYIDMAKDSDASKLIDILSNYLDVGSSLLELGMGAGNDFRLIKEKYKSTGSDKFGTFLSQYRLTDENSDLLLLDAITLDTKRRFDCLYSNKVLMHLSKEELRESINNQHRILSDNGIVFHTFWKGQGEETFYGMLNVYYKEIELEELFSHKFEVVKLKSYAEFDDDDSILLIGIKRSL